MNSTIAGTARRLALTLTVAGIAALGSVAVAPSASAAPPAGKGPALIMDLEHGKMPVFECNPDKPNQRHNNCIDMDAPTRF
jgi:hypothetical protein